MSDGNTKLTEFRTRIARKENLLPVIEKSPALLSLLQHKPGLLGHFESRKEEDWEVLRAAFQKHYDKRVEGSDGDTSRKAAFAALVLAVSAGPARKRKSKKRKK